MGYLSSQFRKVAPARIDQRAVQRQTLFLECAASTAQDKAMVPAQLVDLSAYGCRILIDSDLQCGEQIYLRFADDVPIAANIVWNEGGRLGCRFDTALEQRVFKALILQSDTHIITP